MGKKPHFDFPQRKQLDGSEELYTQHADYSPPEQKFTLAQVKQWLLADLPVHFEMLIATEHRQTTFSLKYPICCPILAEVHFEKCRLHYGQSFIIRENQLIYTGTDFDICQGEQITITYFFNQNHI